MSDQQGMRGSGADTRTEDSIGPGKRYVLKLSLCQHFKKADVLIFLWHYCFIIISDKRRPTYIGCAYHRARLCAWYIIHRRQVSGVIPRPTWDRSDSDGRASTASFWQHQLSFRNAKLSDYIDRWIHLRLRFDKRQNNEARFQSKRDQDPVKPFATGTTRRRISKQEPTSSRQ